MKYTIEIKIDASRERIIDLLENPDNLSSYLPNLILCELVKGKVGEVGAVTHLINKLGDREIEIIMTVTRRDLPFTLVQTYESSGMWNEITNRFVDKGDHTEWLAEVEFHGTGWKWLMGLLAPGSLKKDTLEQMERLRDFAESAA